MSYVNTPAQLFLFQAIAVPFIPNDLPGAPIFYKHFPVFKRFMYASFLHALSRALMTVISSFGLVYLVNYFGYWGITILTVPITLCYRWAILHFEQLELRASSSPAEVSA